jgi:hypothetical protein
MVSVKVCIHFFGGSCIYPITMSTISCVLDGIVPIHKTKYHIQSGHQKQCAARCCAEQKKCVFSLDKLKRMVTLEMLLKCLNAGNVTGSHDGEKS